MPNPPVAIPPTPNRPRTPKLHVLFVAAGAISVAVVAGLFIFFPHGKPRSNAPAVKAPLPSVVAPVQPEESPTNPREVASAPAAPELPATPPHADKSHIEIIVQPAGAFLSLDGRPVGGNLIKMDVASSKKTHVVQARSPGYLPFKKTLNFATDVYLDIKLEKPEEPAPVVRAKTHPPVVASPPPPPSALKVASPPPVAPKVTPPPAAPAEDFGMSLQRPTPRRPTKKIDETDPYGP